MLRRTACLNGGSKRYTGVDVNWCYPRGLPKRTFPMREGMKHPAFAPNPGGLWGGKYQVTFPMFPMELNFYRVPVFATLLAMLVDLVWGLPIPLMREQVPNKPRHFWNGNNAGSPHHFWCYQDGWFVPNESGVKRMRE